MTRSERFVWQAVQDFLGHAPSDERVRQDSARLDRGLPVRDYVGELTTSEEWAGALIQRFYLDTLERSPDPDGLAHWVGQLQTGVPVASVAASFYGSAEYVRLAGGTLEAWVDELYRVLLRREPDEDGRAFWVGRATSSTEPVALEFYQSAESRQQRVDGLYLQLLGRRPDDGGRAHWTAQLADGNDLALAHELGASAEYYERAVG